MTTVRMRTHISGTRNGKPWPPKGGTITLPPDEAEHLIATRLAEPTQPQPADTTHDPGRPEEHATAPAEEEETATPARKRSRKRG